MRRALASLAALLLASSSALAQAPGGTPLPPPDAPPAGASPPDVPAGGPERARPAPGAPGEDPPDRQALPAEAVLDEVVGTVRAIDRDAHVVVVDTDGGPETLGLDRNTLVYGPGGLSTVLELRPGSRIRAARNARSVAYWVQLRAETTAPPSTPGQGTGPAGAGPGPIEPGGPRGSGAGPAGALPRSGGPGADPDGGR